MYNLKKIAETVGCLIADIIPLWLSALLILFLRKD